MADYSILVRTPTGQLIAEVTRFRSLEYVLVENDVGAMTLTLGEEIPFDWLARDTRLEIRRSVNGAEPSLEGETVWFVRRPEDVLSTGVHTRTLTAWDAKDLLRRRIVAYKSGTAQAHKLQPLDDMCKAIVRENLGSLATNPLRDLSAYLSVQADVSFISTYSKSFNFGKVLTVCQEIADLASSYGEYLAFDVVRVSDTQLEFRTYKDYRGTNHRFPISPAPVLLSPESGTLGDVRVTYDYASEVTVVYAGGGGEGANRTIVEATDPMRTTLTPFNRIEQFRDARRETPAGIANEANLAMWEGQPRVHFAANIIDTDAVRYGLHYRHGDVVTAQWSNVTFNCRVDPVHVTVSEAGEQIDAQLSEDALL